MLKRLRRLIGEPVEIPEDLWREPCVRFGRLGALDAGALARLRGLCAGFLGQKRITAVAGLELTAAIELHIAVQACLPILELGLDWYQGWSGVVVYPAAFLVHRRIHDDAGVIHEFDDELSGEAWQGGPVVLSWADARDASEAGNVVIHEFAHKLDLLDGEADGMPPFDPRLHRGLKRGAWLAALDDAYQRFGEALDLVEADIPPDLDPDSAQADTYYARLPLDPYAATDAGEFFAVSSEVYFLDPARLFNAFPDWYRLLHRFYRFPINPAYD